MSKARVIVLSVTEQGMTKSEAARKFGISRRWVHTLVTRYQTGGLPAIEPRSRRPRESPAATSAEVRDRILQLRHQLVTDGLDAGPITIAWHLQQGGFHTPAASTIRRILLTAGVVTPEPAKRPKSSYLRFQADQPNETWQSDFTHWALADGTDVEILNWLDDHSRLLLGCTAHRPVTDTTVIVTFTELINQYGPPASTLTDNGSVYTSRFTGGKNGFEYLLTTAGITQKNGHPYHPQTQGKIERFHQTLKLWLSKQPSAATIAELQTQLDLFRTIYNQQRPHRALDRKTPRQAYNATIKATPGSAPLGAHYRVRYDTVDRHGKLTLRHAGSLHHLGVGRGHGRKPALILVDATTVTVTNRNTGEVLGTYDINPTANYWPKKQESPATGRAPSN